MPVSSPMSSQAAETLQSAIAGDVFLPGHPGYDEACRAWILTTRERPAVVVLVRSAADVVEAVKLARVLGMRIAAQGTGHGSEPLESLVGAMLIRTLPMRRVEIRQLGGVLGRPVPGGGAQPAIDARFLMYCNGMTPTPELTDVVRARARALKDALAPWHADYDFYNLRESAGPASAVLSAEAYRRLQEIKARYDPEQAIISVHPVWPSRTES